MFLISKIVAYLLEPLLWIIILLAFGWLSKNKRLKRRLFKTAVIMLIVFSNTYLLNNVWNSYQWKPVDINDVPASSTGILLGGLSSYDQWIKKNFFREASDRFIQTTLLYETGKISRILVTGGNAIFVSDSTYSEAEFLRNSFRELHIPDSAVIIETKARNTVENAVFSDRIMREKNLESPPILITSAIHMPRAVKIFKKAGVEVIPFPSNYLITVEDTEFKLKNMIPSANTLNKWGTLLKEWVGLLKTS